jgi:hypothetical protein
VKTAGKWQKDGREGVYRVVVMRDAAGGIPSRLFVQWLAVGADGAAAFDHGIEVTEVAGEKLDIADITTENDPDGLTVFVQTQDAAAGGGQSYELFINDDGTYRFGPASN